MNKKRLIGILLVVAIILLTSVSVKVPFPGSSPSNSNASRRDGGSGQRDVVSDEDLEAVSGDPGEEVLSADQTEESPDSANQFGSPLIGANSNKPTSVEVKTVRIISIPEAVNIEEGDSGIFYSNKDFSDIIPVDIHSFSEKEIPAKYDSRDVNGKCYVTAVEDQGYTALCWSYAALGALESDILKHYDIDPGKLDLSEKHLAYYNVHKAEGSLMGGIDGDYRELVASDDDKDKWIFDYDTGYVCVGGVNNYCISILTSWKGPVSELSNDSFESVYGQRFIYTDNGNVPSDAYNSEYHVQDVYELKASLENNRRVKQLIMSHGAVSVGISADNRFWKGCKQALYASFGGEPVPNASHEVLIVGWDDDYSADNFGTKPEGNGAWICRNSWGTGTGYDGFFYMSYYDETARNSNVGAYNAIAPGTSDWYDNNYQVAGYLDKTVSTIKDELNTVTAYTSSDNPYGIVYTAASDETLKAVGFMSLDTYQQYEVEVYMNPMVKDNNIRFQDLEEPVLVQKVSAISGGYHTFKLNSDIELAKGEDFLVLIKPYTSGRLVFESESDDIGDANYDEWHNYLGGIHNNYEASGRSYYIADDGKGLKKEPDKDFFLKAYTVNR